MPEQTLCERGICSARVITYLIAPGHDQQNGAELPVKSDEERRIAACRVLASTLDADFSFEKDCPVASLKATLAISLAEKAGEF